MSAAHACSIINAPRISCLQSVVLCEGAGARTWSDTEPAELQFTVTLSDSIDWQAAAVRMRRFVAFARGLLGCGGEVVNVLLP